jgi:ech hydrogenase subunit F
MFKMTRNIVRNFVTRRATRPYPCEVRTPFERTRGAIHNDIEQCTFCSVCAVKCPSQCITVDRERLTWTCDPFACVYCGICEGVCPEKCLKQEEESPVSTGEPRKIVFRGKEGKRRKPGNEPT